MEIKHPGQILQQELIKKNLTQKDFAKIVGKKVSEVNELIKGKRNITVQRDILLSAFFDEPEKRWVSLQMNYDYAIGKKLIDIKKIREIKNRRTKRFQEIEGEQPAEIQPTAPEKLENIPSKIEEEEETLRYLYKKKQENLAKQAQSIPVNQKKAAVKPTPKETIPQINTPPIANPEAKKDKTKEHEIFIRF